MKETESTQQISSSRSNGHDSELPLDTSTWHRLLKSSSVYNPGTGRSTTRRSSSNRDSSQGRARGPWLQKPYSSSAFARSILKIGWFRYVARTMNLLRLGPTHTATWPAGTSDVASRAFLRHRRSICRTRTMRRILLQFPVVDGDILQRSERRTERNWVCEWVRFRFGVWILKVWRVGSSR